MCAEPRTACVVPGQPGSPTPSPRQPGGTLLIPMRGSPTSWGLLQFLLWPHQRVCGKGLEVLLCQSQTVRSLIALSGPACLNSAISISILLLLPHNEGYWVLFDFLSFLIPQYEGQVLPDLGSHILSHLCPSPGKVPSATSSLFTPFCFANIHTQMK